MTGDQVSKGSDGIMIVEYEQKQGNVVPDGFNSHYLKVYYDGKHPACDQSYFSRREFSFTLENDVYLRFQSFNSVPELESSVKEKCPVKIDIGPVYSVDPVKRHAYAQSGDNVSTPVERELIFDIDMSDYDDVRYCCSGADVCLECWPLMTIAIKMTLVSVTFSGYIVVDVEFIAGFVMGKQEGSQMNREQLLLTIFVSIREMKTVRKRFLFPVLLSICSLRDLILEFLQSSLRNCF